MSANARSLSHVTLRVVLWLGIAGSAVLGFLGGMGRGPGLLLAAIAIAFYDVARGSQTSLTGYGLLIAGLAAITTIWWVVPLL